MKKLLIHFISWDKVSIDSRISALKADRFDVIFGVPQDRNFFQSIEEKSPAAVLIDLTRSPSQGRDIAVTLRTRKATRAIPIVFIKGVTGMDSIRQLLPDAIFSSWDKVVGDIQRAVANPPSEPVVPGSVFAAYSGVPLAKKIGIKAGSSILAIHPPGELDTLLGNLPEGVTLCKDDKVNCDILLWFLRSQIELEKEIASIASRPDFKSLWMIWPKKTSRLASDITQQTVRKTGLAHGLVDYKICSLDATWTGLCFAKRK